MHTLHVEALQERESRASAKHVERLVRAFLSRFPSFTPGVLLSGRELDGGGGELAQHVTSLALCDAGHEEDAELRAADTKLLVHVLVVGAGAVREELGGRGGWGGGWFGGDEPAQMEVRALPAAELHGLWESLVYEDKLKDDVLRFVETAFEFSSCGVDERQVAWSRVLLLHGPPGTGKTSLCRALAHKLAVRLAPRFPRARLLEINAHGLFSKWFSESSKQVARLFDRIQEMTQDEHMLVCVLVDEVESLAGARRAAAAGLEPSDSIRAVNAVLCALDRLRRAPNALLLATSNVSCAVDAAFLDRTDLARLVPPPGAAAAYSVLRGALQELSKRGVLVPGAPPLPLRVVRAGGAAPGGSLRLWEVAREAAAHGVSGRALRRLPFLARALHLRGAPPTDAAFVEALADALAGHVRDTRRLADDAPAPRAHPHTNTN